MVAIFKKTKKRRSWQTVLVSTVLGLLSLGLIAFLAISNFKISEKRKVLEADIEEAKAQVEILQEQKNSLAAGINESEKADFQEERIREQGYKKPGEEVIAILQDKATIKEEQAVEEKSFWLNLWDKIKNFSELE
jgi:cell division protein FtsB